MANPFGKPISRLTVKEILQATPEQIAKLDVKQTETLAKKVKKISENRIKTLNKYKVFSHAKEAYMPDGSPPVMPINKGNAREYRNKLQHNIAVNIAFLEAKTSTLVGAKADKKAMEERIFGKTSKGPKHHFNSLDEERRFWAAYDEFKNQHKEYNVMGSTRLQQFLGRMTFWRKRSFTARDLDKLFINMSRGSEPIDARQFVGSEVVDDWED